MKPSYYIKEALVTESADPGPIKDRLAQNYRLIHAGMGLATESAEIVDALKKGVFYGKPVDMLNMKEEVGDLLWYVAIICDDCGFTLEDAMETNIRKLRTRYPNKFSEHDAIHRNLEIETISMEGR